MRIIKTICFWYIEQIINEQIQQSLLSVHKVIINIDFFFSNKKLPNKWNFSFDLISKISR